LKIQDGGSNIADQRSKNSKFFKIKNVIVVAFVRVRTWTWIHA